MITKDEKNHRQMLAGRYRTEIMRATGPKYNTRVMALVDKVMTELELNDRYRGGITKICRKENEASIVAAIKYCRQFPHARNRYMNFTKEVRNGR